MRVLALGLLLLAGQADAVPPGETWPQWRGPSGDSVVPGPGLPTRWGPGENVVWKVTPPGWGNSTPAVWKDALFLTSQDGDRLLLLRLERRSGKVVWQREVGRGTPRRTGSVGKGRFNDEHNMASPSPVTDGRHVWAHFGNGDLACYDYAGNRVWALNLAQRFGEYTVWWGHANSPVLVDGVIVSACMQDPAGGGRSYVVAHDQETGRERWFVERKTGAASEPADSYTTPLVYRAGGRAEVIVFGGNVLDAYDPATGKRLWWCHAFKGNRVISGPTLAGGVVYAVQGMRGPLFAVRAGGHGDVTDKAVLWKYVGSTPDAATPLVTNGLVFLATNAGVAVCVDAATGRQLWKERLGDQFRASPLAAGGKVYFLTRDGKGTVVEAAREFRVVARNDLGETTIASPAAAGGELFIRTREHLYCIGPGGAASR